MKDGLYLDDVLTTKEAAAFLKECSEQWVREHARELGGVKVGGLGYRFLKSNIIKYLHSLHQRTQVEGEYIRG